MSKYYLRIEGVNLANFVYDTQELSVIRGGSFMLLNAIDYIKQKYEKELTVIYTAASAGLFSFDAINNEKATELQYKIENTLNSDSLLESESNTTYELKHATFVVSIIPATGNFVKEYESLVALNHWSQMQQPSLAIPSQNNVYKESCNFDLVRPKVDEITKAEKSENVSASVKVRIQYGRKQKQVFYKKQTGLGDNILTHNFSYDLDDLTSDPKQGNLHNKMAVIYLDGNSFGSIRREKCKEPGKLAEFSNGIIEKRNNLLKSLLENEIVLPSKDWLSKKDTYRIETLLWGGDEILWVVPAWQGWSTLSFFFEQAKDWKAFKEDKDKLTHAAGIVFCHHTAAITRIKQLAHDLAEVAKKESRNKNLFAYQILESFDHIGRDLNEFRQQRCPPECSPVGLIIDGLKMKDIENHMPAVKKVFPKRKLYDIVNNLYQDPSKAASLINEVRGKKGSEIYEAVSKLEDDFKKENDVEKNNIFWIHLLELWDYVAPEVKD